MLTLQEIQDEMQELKDWSLESNSITKDFIFKDFKEALIFVNKVGEIAENLRHHPDIMINTREKSPEFVSSISPGSPQIHTNLKDLVIYNSVRLTLTTHSEKGLTKKDFDVANGVDKLF